MNRGEAIKREIKYAIPGARYKDFANLLNISYQQLFTKFRNGHFTDKEIDLIASEIGGTQHHYLVLPDGRKIDVRKGCYMD